MNKEALMDYLDALLDLQAGYLFLLLFVLSLTTMLTLKRHILKSTLPIEVYTEKFYKTNKLFRVLLIFFGLGSFRTSFEVIVKSNFSL